MKNKFFVFGSQGFIGRHLVKYLIKKRYLTIGIARKEKIFTNKNYKHICSDVYQFKNYIKHLDKYSTIIFLAFSNFNNNEVIKFKTLMKILGKKKVKNILFLSSASVYGNNKNINSELVPTKPINNQGKYFLKIENIILNISQKNKINFLILRTFNVFGVFRKNRGMIESFIKRLIKDDKIFQASGLNNLRTYISVNDLTKIIFKLLKLKKKNLIINICNPFFVYSLKDISKKIYKITKKKFSKIVIIKNKELINYSVCTPNKLIKMNLVKFYNNFNLELKKIVLEFSK